MKNNGVSLFDWEAWEADENRPCLILSPGEGTEPSALAALSDLPRESRTLVLFERLPEGAPWSGPGEHVLIGLHISPGATRYSHDGCLFLSLCVGCDSDVLDAILEAGAGCLMAHSHDPGSSAPVRFLLGDVANAAEIVASAKTLLR